MDRLTPLSGNVI